jgi:hypothetical protein
VVRRRAVPKAKPKRPKVGDKVIVEFGGDDHVGTVLDVNGWTSVHVMVEVWSEPTLNEPSIRTYKLEDLRPVDAAA